MGIVRSPNQRLDASVIAELNAEIVLLKAEKHMAAEDIAGQLAMRIAVRGLLLSLDIHIVEYPEEVKYPGDLKLDRTNFELGEAVEHAAIDHIREAMPHPVWCPVPKPEGTAGTLFPSH